MKQSLDNTIGAIFLGIVGASMLFGVTTLQTLWYYHAFRSDTKVHRFSVGLLWFLDALHLALIVQAVYSYAINGFGDIAGLSLITWSLKVQQAINVLIILIVQFLYASRVWLIGGFHHAFLKYIVIFVVTAGFGIGSTLVYLTFTVHSFPELELDKIKWAVYAALAVVTTIDIVITVSMCYYLSKSKGRLTLLNSRISVVIHYTLSSGLLTSACSLAAMFSYRFLRETYIFIALLFILTKLYVNSFLAMLNCRQSKESAISQSNTSVTLPTWERSNDVGLNSKIWNSVDVETCASPSRQRLATSPVETSNQHCQ